MPISPFKENVVCEYREAKVPYKKSIEDGLIQKNSDFTNLQRKISEPSIKNLEMMLFIKNHIPFGNKKITTTQDDCNYNKRDYYKKNELSLKDRTFKI